jgi:hypothetical protein
MSFKNLRYVFLLLILINHLPSVYSQPQIDQSSAVPKNNVMSEVWAPIEKTNFVVRDIFQLKFGHYRDAIALVDDAVKLNLMPPGNMRVMTDFTGDAYRLILEIGFNSLAEYEKTLTSELNAAAWKDWYEKFKSHVESSSREILKWVR